MHTDKPYYAEGDTIWYRVHLVDGATNMPVARSRFVYVEMYDQTADTLMERQMVKCDSDGVFENAFLLPKKLQSGQYTIVAYTQWMRNFGAEQFFYKPLSIVGELKGKNHGDRFMTQSLVKQPISMIPRPSLQIEQPKDWVGLRGNSLFIQPHQSANQDMACIVLDGGNVIAFDPKKDKVHRIDTHSLKSGYVRVVLIDRNTLKTLDECLVLNHRNQAKVSVTGQARTKKEQMEIDVSLTDDEGRPLRGCFSLSVADYDVVKPDSVFPDLAKYLMERPSLIPMEDMLNQRYPDIEYGFQQEQTITGSVRGTLRKKIKQPRLLIVNPAQGWRKEVELGSGSRFSLTVDIPERSTILLEATRRSGKTEFVQLTVDTLTFPNVKLPSVKVKQEGADIPTEFISQTRTQQKFSMAGVIELPEVVKIGHQKQHQTMNWSGMEPIRSYGPDHPLFERVATMSQLFNYLNINHIGKVYVDNFPMDEEEMRDELFRMIPSLIKSIEFFPKGNPANSFFGVRPDKNGVLPAVLFIFTKDPSEMTRTLEKYRLSKAVVQQLGYRYPVEFYSPQYPDADKGQYTRPDYRTTLYWNPKIKFDESGRTQVKFYASDVSKRYLITIEGVSDDGFVVSKQVVIE